MPYDVELPPGLITRSPVPFTQLLTDQLPIRSILLAIIGSLSIFFSICLVARGRQQDIHSPRSVSCNPKVVTSGYRWYYLLKRFDNLIAASINEASHTGLLRVLLVNRLSSLRQLLSWSDEEPSTYRCMPSIR